MYLDNHQELKQKYDTLIQDDGSGLMGTIYDLLSVLHAWMHFDESNINFDGDHIPLEQRDNKLYEYVHMVVQRLRNFQDNTHKKYHPDIQSYSNNKFKHIFMIYIYTLSILYYGLNSNLINNKHNPFPMFNECKKEPLDNLKCTAYIAHSLTNALNSITPLRRYKCDVWRADMITNVEQYTPNFAIGAKFEIPCFWSAAIVYRQAISYLNKKPNAVMFQIMDVYWHDISLYTADHINEGVFPRGSKFELLDIYESPQLLDDIKVTSSKGIRISKVPIYLLRCIRSNNEQKRVNFGSNQIREIPSRK